MYFTPKNSFFHGIMFHHFHNTSNHLKGQGSISRNDFIKIIKFIGLKNIISPEESIKYITKKSNIYKKRINKVCLTFDDSLKCQYDIVLPVLEKYNLKAFFFIYSGAFSKEPELLEIHRYFRVNYFKNINEFYYNFFKILFYSNPNAEKFLKNKRLQIKLNKKKYPFYSLNDIKFRLIRDHYLVIDDYNNLMEYMFKIYKFKPKNIIKDLFMSKKNLLEIIKKGHSVGLHSHSHPTHIEKLPYSLQENEYKKNLHFINNILKKKSYKINSVSHPCGSYSLSTLKILFDLKIDIGFKNFLDRNQYKSKFSNLEIDRENHALIIKRLKK
ncbi:polysaccharide deacetylase family protein [Pelagibacteraceae bacterium]|nr:polysaccharide deacetylase family protein [Pelagibacteraceae bacterium]